ncbi:hypothetical protein V8J82_00040 [Gymnodinialimonas sp. 2305UL16-5]|uniref:hypothetical protein n=1 Tax=Gymnodinialimonas mytili TaxID=3126503 RepID=UPI0030B7267C
MQKIFTVRTDDLAMDADVNEYRVYKGKPFTGIEEDYVNGVLQARSSLVEGTEHGYVHWLGTDRFSEMLAWHASNMPAGIRIYWNLDGNLESVEKVWGSETIERLHFDGDRRWIEPLFPLAEQAKLRTDPALGSPYNRQEPVDVLYDQAMERMESGSLFDDPALYRPADYYD